MGVVPLFHLLNKGNQVLFIYFGEELISFLGHANMCAFHAKIAYKATVAILAGDDVISFNVTPI